MKQELKIKSFQELSLDELYEILRSRAEVFVCEQGILCADPDGVDRNCYHVFLLEDGLVTAYLRAIPEDGGVVRIGRVLTLHHGQGRGRELMEFALKAVPEKIPCRKMIMDAQVQAVPFYRKFGFEVTSGEYLEEGIPHVDMCLTLEET